MSFQYWSDVYLWNGDPYQQNPVFGPKDTTLMAGETRITNIAHRIPQKTPLKTHKLCGRIGFHPDEIWVEDCFEFTVVEGPGYPHDSNHWEVIESSF